MLDNKSIEETLSKATSLYEPVLSFNAENINEYVPKKWGAEYIICRAPHAAKVMVLNPGCQCSLHFHGVKSETFILIQGELELTLCKQDGTQIMDILKEPFSSVTIAPLVPHTFKTPDNQEHPTIFIEASTTDSPNDSYRIYPSRGKK